MSYETPSVVEIQAATESPSPDSLEADTTLVAGTRKLMSVMFTILRIEIPSQKELEAHLEQVAIDSEPR